MSEPMTLEQVRDKLRELASNPPKNVWRQMFNIADAIDAHLAQPAHEQVESDDTEAMRAFMAHGRREGLMLLRDGGRFVNTMTRAAYNAWMAAQPAQAVDVTEDMVDRAFARFYSPSPVDRDDPAWSDMREAITRALSGPVGDGWKGLTDDEQAKFVGTICDYGTEFVTPLFSVIDSVETILRKRNTSLPASPTPDKEGA